MSIEKFSETIKEALVSKITNKTNITIQNFMRDGRELYGLTFTKKNSDTSATIYMEFFFELFKNGCSLDYIAERVCNEYQKYNNTYENVLSITEELVTAM